MQPLSRGVHHLALNTDDMKKTLDFYVGVLGMPLVHALKVAPGLDSLLAFFEIPKGMKPKGDRDAIGTMQHVSFCVPEERFNEVRKRVEAARVQYVGPINVGCDTWSIYFFDPNGIRLEFSHQKEAQPRVIERWRQTKAEALEELRTLSSDGKWLETLVAHLPERR